MLANKSPTLLCAKTRIQTIFFCIMIEIEWLKGGAMHMFGVIVASNKTFSTQQKCH